MPKKIERKLKSQAKKKGYKGKKADAYVYGTLNKIKGMTVEQAYDKKHGRKNASKG